LLRAPALVVFACLLGAPAGRALLGAGACAQPSLQDTVAHQNTTLHDVPPWHSGLARMAPPRAAGQGPSMHRRGLHDFLFRVLVHPPPVRPRSAVPSPRLSCATVLNQLQPVGFCLTPPSPVSSLSASLVPLVSEKSQRAIFVTLHVLTLALLPRASGS